jgi:hypothetical protein
VALLIELPTICRHDEPRMAAFAKKGEPPAAAAAMNAEERQEWLAQLKVGDCIDFQFAGVNHGWFSSQIIGATATHFTVHPLYYGSSNDKEVERASERLQPYCSKTKGKYTGGPRRERYANIAPVLPQLQPVPLHPQHQLQRFQFDIDTACVKCSKAVKKGGPTYSCLSCCYDLCTRCFVAVGGVDTHPLPCQPPQLKSPSKLANYEAVEFVMRVDRRARYRGEGPPRSRSHLRLSRIRLSALQRIHPSQPSASSRSGRVPHPRSASSSSRSRFESSFVQQQR